MSDTVPIEKIKIEGFFETTTPFKISGDEFVDEKNQPIDIASIFTFKMYEDSDDKINNLEQNKLYTVGIPPGDIKRGGKSKKKRGGNKRKTKSNRNKR
jgi:hypothetical protein